MMPADAYIALGSNLGDRSAQLRAAACALAESCDVELIASSRVYETAPIGPPGQGPYLNAVLHLRSGRAPRALLELLQAVELRAGRRRGAGEQRWGPRCLDLDLLLLGDQCFDEAALQLPHPRLHERAFVLEPLCDLAPDLVHPLLGCSMLELKSRLAQSANSGAQAGGAAGLAVDDSAVEVWGPAEWLVPGR